uniref:Chaperone DnaJ C-terminal domain-containing protein n=1 Tax=viral metagenome TaxID=1070528 RepID=A0A6C0AZB2_9ZZZZ
MASQIANNMSEDDKSAIENMDMENMISHVTKNVFQMMSGGESDGSEIAGLSELMGSMGNIMGNFKQSPNEILERPQIPREPFMGKSFPKTRDICFDLNVDLVDFYTGKKKKINIKRKRVVEVDGKQKIVEEKKKIVIPIERGMKDEQQIRFEGEADQIPGYTPGDIVITLIENEHPLFQRDGDNLIIIKNINIYQLYDYSFDIIHLDERVLRICKNVNDALHLNDSLRKISGEGMPIYKKPNEFGDLFIRFNLIIPKSLEADKLVKLKVIFETLDETLSETYSKKLVLENVTDTDLEDFEEESESSESDTDDSRESDSVSVSSASSEPEREFKRRPRKR